MKNKIFLTIAAIIVFISTTQNANANANANIFFSDSLVYKCSQVANVVTCINTKTNVSESWIVNSDGEIKSGTMEDCAPLPTKVQKFLKCAMCLLIRPIFDTANTLIDKSFTTLSTPLITIMSLVFAIIIAIKVLGQVSSFTATSSGAFIDDLLQQGFKFIIAFLFLTMYEEVYVWIINPLLSAGIEMGAAFLENSPVAKASFPGEVTGKYISPKIYDQIDMFIQAVNQELGFIMAIGGSLMCIAFNSASVLENVFPDASLLISGLVLFIISLTTLLAFSFYLIDGVLQLCVVGILTPFSLASYPFGFSQKWMMTTWAILIDTMFKFILMGIAINLVVKIMAFSVTGGLGGQELIMQAMNSNDPTQIASFFDITSMAFISFCVCSIFAKKMTGKASDLAAALSGGSVISAGGTLGGLVAQLPKLLVDTAYIAIAPTSPILKGLVSQSEEAQALKKNVEDKTVAPKTKNDNTINGNKGSQASDKSESSPKVTNKAPTKSSTQTSKPAAKPAPSKVPPTGGK